MVELARKQGLLSEEYFSVDGTLIQAWPSQKSFRPKEEDDNEPDDEGRDFHREKRLNDTHESRTDKEVRNYKKSKGSEAKMAYLGHTVMENRSGLIVKADASLADGYVERDTALRQLKTLQANNKRQWVRIRATIPRRLLKTAGKIE